MEQIVERQRRDFEERLEQEDFDRQVRRIEEERDARIAGINRALVEKETALTASYEEERADVLAHLADLLADYQAEYIDGIKDAFKQAGVDLVDFIDTINDDLAKRTRETTGEILRMVDELNRARHAIGGTPSYGVRPAPSLPDTFPSSPPSVVTLPDTTRKPVTVNVYPLTADLNENALARELWRVGVLNGG
jgi:hypothetical protein